MTFTLTPPVEFTVIIPFPSEHQTIKEYLEFMNLIGTPPLLLIAEFAMVCANSYEHMTEEKSYEWIERRIIDMLYQAGELESYNAEAETYSPYNPPISLPINNFIESLGNDENSLTRFNLFMIEITRLFSYLYSHLPFPEKFRDLDPFYEFSINLLNPDSAFLEITEKDDVEYFTDLIT